MEDFLELQKKKAGYLYPGDPGFVAPPIPEQFRTTKEGDGRVKPRVGAQEEVGFIEREGKKFALPRSDIQRLRKAGKLLPGETIAEQRAMQQLQDVGAEALGPLAAAGAFEQVTPEEVSLAPEQRFGEKLPLIGPPTAALQGVLANALRKGWIPILETKDFEDVPITEETLREGALRQIRDNSMKEGISSGESFGAFVEAIPIAGNLIARYIPGLVEAPYGNAQEVFKEITQLGEEATNNQEKTAKGFMPAPFAMNRAREMEESVADLEGRLQALINTSAILRANKDEVNKIQAKIFQIKVRIDNFRIAASQALTAELTGTGRPIRTDEEMYFELAEQNK